MSGSYPRTENDVPDEWSEAEEAVAANDNQLEALEQVINVAGHFIGPYSDVVVETAGMDTSAHHIVQDFTVKGLSGYETNRAVAISLTDQRGRKGTQHYYATQQQRTATIGGTLGAEMQVARDALEASGIAKAAVNVAMGAAEAYFSSIDQPSDAETEIPTLRNIEE